MLSDDSDDRSCWIGSNVVGGKMSGVVFRLVLLELLESIVVLPESVGTSDDAAVAAEGVSFGRSP